MAQVTCPGCGFKSAYIEDDQSGPLRCGDCGQSLDHLRPARARGGREAEQPVQKGPMALRRRPNSRPLWPAIAVAAVFGIAVVAALFYAVFKSDVVVYVDNGGSQTLTVFLDDVQVLQVPPGKMKELWCRSGQKKIVVKSGEKVVFDEGKNLKAPEYGGPRKYLLNPEATIRYWQETVLYGQAMPNFNQAFSETGRYNMTADLIRRLPAVPWHDIQADHVLEPAPQSVQGRFSSQRTVVHRISRADYDFLADAAKVNDMRFADWTRLNDIVDRLNKTK